MLPSQRKCFCPLNNNLSRCDLCAEKLAKPECVYCYCQRFGKVYDESKSHENDSLPKELITAKEIRTFHIKLRIEDSDGEIKILSTNQDWEVVGKRGEGKFSKMETGEPAGGEVQIVEFWKNGKKYELAIGGIFIYKGWFGDQANIYKIEPVPEDAFTILTETEFRKNYFVFPRRSSTLIPPDEFKNGLEIRNYQWRKPGKILVSVFVAMVILVCVSFLIGGRKKFFTRTGKK